MAPPLGRRLDCRNFTFNALCHPWSNHEMLDDSKALRSVVHASPPPPPPPMTRVPPPLSALQSSLPPPVTAFGGLRPSGCAPHFDTVPPPFSVLVALWPNLLPDSSFEPLGYPTFSYTLNQFTEMLLALKANGLVFATLLPSADQSNIVEELMSKLSAQLSERGLQLPGPTGPATDTGPSQWFHLPWIMLESSRRQVVFRFIQHSRASANTFNRKMILDANSKFVNPDPEHSGLPLILDPRFGHVRGPLSHIFVSSTVSPTVDFIKTWNVSAVICVRKTKSLWFCLHCVHYVENALLLH
ncbi:hypothetical protein K438DRAFT_1988818 [Mycena galopus ATCC 62051]|nr:hypothetical protein K438DRAFT_1988818 [Mycena galopus ATCC 62051]